MVRTGERVVVPDPDLYAQDPGLGSFSRRHADEQAAIGNVKRTDVMTIELHGLETIPGPNGLLALDRVAMPASRSALWSFAEVLKLACADELSVGPNELLTGLQPDRREGELTARVFVADSLENGAGTVDLPSTRRQSRTSARDHPLRYATESHSTRTCLGVRHRMSRLHPLLGEPATAPIG